jgi:hypothetical protein
LAEVESLCFVVKFFPLNFVVAELCWVNVCSEVVESYCEEVEGPVFFGDGLAELCEVF